MIKRLEARTKGAAGTSLVEMRAEREPSDLKPGRMCWGPDQYSPSVSLHLVRGLHPLGVQEAVF